MLEERVALGVLAVIGSLAAGCIQISRTPTHPETFEGIDAMCRRSAEDYRVRDRAYERCMHEHGYPNQGADDY